MTNLMDNGSLDESFEQLRSDPEGYFKRVRKASASQARSAKTGRFVTESYTKRHAAPQFGSSSKSRSA
jgi:hypothetical protein